MVIQKGFEQSKEEKETDSKLEFAYWLQDRFFYANNKCRNAAGFTYTLDEIIGFYSQYKNKEQ